jgi:uncharacterized protein GlcG (DUF336 family)
MSLWKKSPEGQAIRKCRPTLEALEDRTAPALLASQFTLTEPTLQAAEVEILLERAAVATSSNDAIIAIVDRNGTILGVHIEGGVSPAITGNPALLTFAIDGAVAKARTAAFFANNTAPLTSRTIEFISQSTVSEREVNSYPFIVDPNSTLRGPGFVAPIQVGGHFPPEISFTPPVDLFGIEHTNRDSIVHPGPDRIKGTGDDVLLPYRFNIDPAFVPAGQEISPPLSYGEAILSPADLANPAVPKSQARGIATLPGGIPLYEYGVLVGGIGVFFPGTTGFASEENSVLSSHHNPSKPDRTLEAEFMAFAAAGGSSGAGLPVGAFDAVPALPGFDIPFGRIDLAGITLDVVGPGGLKGPDNLVHAVQSLNPLGNNPFTGASVPVNSMGTLFLDGRRVPEGWLVLPHDGVDLSAAEVRTIIEQGIAQANKIRAQIRLPNDERTRMVFAVSDRTGEVLGLFRMPDATVFSIDVAVAKSRNLAYYNDPAELKEVDRVPGIPPGVAFTNRTFRYLAQPRFPEGIDGKPPGPFSILNDGGIDPRTGLLTAPPQPASAYDTVYGFDSFNPGTNFRDDDNILNQNGIVFFPGSSGVYKNTDGSRILVGGFGVSGDGVDQDDVVTAGGIVGFEPPGGLRVDNFFLAEVRLPYLKFPRNPFG